MRCGAVVVAAGRSQRMGISKTTLVLAGRPVVLRSLDALSAVPAVSAIVLVAGAENRQAFEDLLKNVDYACTVTLSAGGETRQESVRRGVESLPAEIELVLIHDAARPLVTPDLIRAAIDAGESYGAAITAIPVTDTIKLMAADDVIEQTLDRRLLRAAQTPQVFRRDWLESAYRKSDHERSAVEFTDEASLVEWAGHDVHVIPGSEENIKLTRPLDVMLAETLLALRGRVTQ